MAIMTKLHRIAAAIAAFCFLTSPGVVPTGAMARQEQRQQRATPALWVMRDADTTIYLFGTIHVLPPGVTWFEGPVQKAFRASDTLVLEVLTEDEADIARTTMALATDPDGPPLTEKLDAQTRDRYLRVARATGVAPDMLERFHPWYAAIVLSLAPLQKLGYSTDAGVEAVLKADAARRGMHVQALETVAQQLGYFAALPESAQLAYLAATIEQADEAEAELTRMTRNWTTGATTDLSAELNGSIQDLPALADALLYRRNERWAQWIDERMRKPGTVFVAVGAGHLVGSQSVLSDLAARGYKVRRIGWRGKMAN